MTGYWRSDIEGGHKTGPHRTSIKAIEEYEKTYLDPFGNNSYQTSGFKKKDGKVVASATMLTSKHIENLEAIDLPIVDDSKDPKTVPIVITITSDEYKTIKRNGKEWDYSIIRSIIQKYKSDIMLELERIENSGGKDQIVEPNVETTTYSVYITDFINASNSKKKHRHNGNIKDNKKDTFQVFLDKVNYKIIVTIYYGSKTIVS
jgi:hypothetical protein